VGERKCIARRGLSIHVVNLRRNQSNDRHMPARGTKRIVIFTLPPVREIDLVGAADVFTSANRAVAGEPLYEVKIVCAEKPPKTANHGRLARLNPRLNGAR